jgi:hypothetical protein
MLLLLPAASLGFCLCIFFFFLAVAESKFTYCAYDGHKFATNSVGGFPPTLTLKVTCMRNSFFFFFFFFF